MWDQLSQFHFLRPALLLLIIPLIALTVIVKNRRLRSGIWGRVCDEHLLPYLLIGQTGKSSRWSSIRFALVGLAIIIAFAGPAWEKLPQPVFRSQSALVIVLDLSRSMDVEDIKPTRLTRARHKILDILKKRKEGQTALIVYAAEAFVVTPLTEDSNTVASLVKDLGTDLMPYQGSRPEKAIEKSIDLFKQASVIKGHVLLITDGVDSPGMDDAVAQLKRAGHQLSILGVGTEQGAPIADYRGGFVKSQDGSIVVARLDEAALQKIAAKGGGIYQGLTANDEDINRLINDMSDSRLDQAVKAESDKFKLRSDQWREEGPWILLLLLPFIALVFRRGYLVILLAVLVPMPQTSYAFEWSSLWKNQDQRAKSALESGDSKRAAELFRDPEWKAAASYRSENYQETVKALESANTADALYNKGNALAKMGDLQKAIESYDRALKLDPENEDAKYNSKLLKDYLEKNKNNQDKQKDNQNSDQNNQQQNDQQNEQQKQNQSKDSQQDQGDKDQQQAQQQDQQQGQQKDQNEEQQAKSQGDDSQSAEKPEDRKNEQATKQKENDQKQNEDSKTAQKDRQQQDDNNEQKENAQARMADDQLTDEEKRQAQKTEQWLRRIPDDPGGLLRRKFRYQSELDARQAKEEPKPW